MSSTFKLGGHGLLDSITWLAFSFLEANDLAVLGETSKTIREFIKNYLENGRHDLRLDDNPQRFLKSGLANLPAHLRAFRFDQGVPGDLLLELIQKNAATLEHLEFTHRNPPSQVLGLIQHCKSLKTLRWSFGYVADRKVRDAVVGLLRTWTGALPNLTDISLPAQSAVALGDFLGALPGPVTSLSATPLDMDWLALPNVRPHLRRLALRLHTMPDPIPNGQTKRLLAFSETAAAGLPQLEELFLSTSEGFEVPEEISDQAVWKLPALTELEWYGQFTHRLPSFVEAPRLRRLQMLVDLPSVPRLMQMFPAIESMGHEWCQGDDEPGRQPEDEGSLVAAILKGPKAQTEQKAPACEQDEWPRTLKYLMMETPALSQTVAAAIATAWKALTELHITLSAAHHPSLYRYMLEQLPALRRLYITAEKGEDSDGSAAECKELPVSPSFTHRALEYISLVNTFGPLVSPPAMPALKTVMLYEAPKKDAVLELFPLLAAAPALEDLSARKVAVRFSAKERAPASGCNALQQLTLSEIQGEEEGGLMALLRCCPCLSEVDIGNSAPLSDARLYALLRLLPELPCAQTLTNVVLHTTRGPAEQDADRDALLLAALPALPRLRWLRCVSAAGRQGMSKERAQAVRQFFESEPKMAGRKVFIDGVNFEGTPRDARAS